MTINFTDKEAELIRNIILQAIKNGNTVNPEAFIPTPDEYKAICSIFNKITPQ